MSPGDERTSEPSGVATKSASRTRRYAWLAVKVAFSVGILAFVIVRNDPAELGRALRASRRRRSSAAPRSSRSRP
jgi:hypothetical protein